MRSRSHLTATIVGSLTILVACNGGPSSQAPCPEGSGEFPPTACAYVEGRLTAAGAPITGAGSVLMTFAPMGTIVDTTYVELTLP
jgi:hypothetical protein